MRRFYGNGSVFAMLSAGSLRIVLSCLVLLLLVSGPAGAAGQEKWTKPGEEELGKILRDLESYVEKGMGEWKVPGLAVAVVQGDKMIYAKGFGVRTLGKPDAVNEHTLFQIGSTSKAFTAALVAMIQDGGKFRWTDKVVDHMPDFRMYDPWVTSQFMILDLMAQRSGLPAYAGDLQVVLGFDRAHIIGSLYSIKPGSSFRSEFAYQNNLFLVAARLVEQYTAKSWKENIRERIFTPLGMSESSTDLQSFQRSSNAASLHIMNGKKVAWLPGDWPYFFWTYTYGPAGGINSTVLDMAQWMRLQLGSGMFEGKRLISEENCAFMHAPRTVVNTLAKEYNQYYCQGWVYRENTPFPVIWHNGGTSGHKTMVALVPRAQVGIVVLSNLAGTELPEAIAYRFLDGYLGNPEKDWSAQMLSARQEGEKKAASRQLSPPRSPMPPAVLSSYTGDFYNSIYEKAQVARQGRNLKIILGINRTSLNLTPWNRDTFQVAIENFNSQAGFVTFCLDLEGRAKSFRYIGADGGEGIEFTRIESTP